MPIKKINPPRPPKPVDRIQNIKTMRPIGKTKWVKAHWRWDYNYHQWEWVLGHWSKWPQCACGLTGRTWTPPKVQGTDRSLWHAGIASSRISGIWCGL